MTEPTLPYFCVHCVVGHDFLVREATLEKRYGVLTLVLACPMAWPSDEIPTRLTLVQVTTAGRLRHVLALGVLVDPDLQEWMSCRYLSGAPALGEHHA